MRLAFSEGRGKMSELENLKIAALSGDGYAAFLLGKAYMDGRLSAQQNVSRGLMWYVAGATANDGLCLFSLANIYENGKMGVVDKELATYLFNKAYPLLLNREDENEKYTLFYLGYYYFFGKNNIPINYVRSFNLWEKSAKHNFAPAMNNLAFMYYNGLGVVQNKEKALQLYRNTDQLQTIYGVKDMIALLEKELND